MHHFYVRKCMIGANEFLQNERKCNSTCSDIEISWFSMRIVLYQRNQTKTKSECTYVPADLCRHCSHGKSKLSLPILLHIKNAK